MKRFGRRLVFVLKKTAVNLLLFAVGTLVLTGIVLLLGTVFKANWAFAPGIFFVLLVWNFVKQLWGNIKESRNIK